MWVAPPVDIKRLRRDSGFDAEMDKARSKRGKNVHLPVLNSVETVHIRRRFGEDEVLASAAVITPAQVLPKSNTATIRERWGQWAALSARDPGDHLCGGEALRLARKSVPWITLVYSRDNLIVNDCHVGLDARYTAALDAAGDDQARETAILDVRCVGHSSVLAMRPMIECFAGVPSHLIRLGHALESGRQAAAFDEAISAEIDEFFKFRLCVELPAAWHAWRRKSARVLELSRPALDLSPQQEQIILDADNGSWEVVEGDEESLLVTHWCVGRLCSLGCKSAASSKRAVKAAILLSLGGTAVVPLLYRWKYFEKALGKSYRGRKQHDLHLRALQRMFPPSVVAAAAAAMAGDAVAESENAQKTKTNIRGGKVVAFMQSDPEALSWNRQRSSTARFRAS
jgi:hypothetical protein